MNFTIHKDFNRPRQYRVPEGDDLASARGIRNGLLIVLPVWIAIGCAIWSLCK